MTTTPTSPDAFTDPDPMVRAAAVTVAGRTLAQLDPARTRAERAARHERLDSRAGGPLAAVRGLLKDEDELVRRYAAVTLARGEYDDGLGELLSAVFAAGLRADDALDECLRNCKEYPFAVLLNERVHLASLAAVTPAELQRRLLEWVRLSARAFYGQENTAGRAEFLDLLDRLDELPAVRPRAGRVLARAHVLSVPLGRRVGIIAGRDRGLFLQYQEEDVLNPDALAVGAEVLFVANPADPDGAAGCVYVREDVALVPTARRHEDNRLFREVIGPTLRRADGPLVPGVVTRKYELGPDGEERRIDPAGRRLRQVAEVLFADGRSVLVRRQAQRLLNRQLVLLPRAAPADPDRCLPVWGVVVDGWDEIGAVVGSFAREVGHFPTRLLDVFPPQGGHPPLGVVRVPRFREPVQFPLAHPQHLPEADWWLLLRPCADCEGSGQGPCQACGATTRVACRGELPCPSCWGEPNRAGRPCNRCAGSGTVTGCGETGKAPCRACRGRRRVDCVFCNKSGFSRPGVTCQRCGGSKEYECRPCRGSGEGPCPVCEGTTRAPCGACRAAGRVPCPTCYRVGLLPDRRVDCRLNLPPAPPVRPPS